MTTDNILGLALRTLPALIVFVLAFVAAADRNTRARWANILYQMGSVRADQRDDPRVQGGVRLPFFAVALLLLVWPLLFYRHATRTFEVKSNLYTQPHRNSIYDRNRTDATATDATSTDAASTSAAGQRVNPGAASNSAPQTRTNLYGTPMPG